MELVTVEYYDSYVKRWRKAKVSSTSDVIKALSGIPGKRFDQIRRIYRYPQTEEKES